MISVTGLSKKYRIGASRNQPYRTIRESLRNTILQPLKQITSGAALGNTEFFHALDNVSFDIQRGDVVGIIGKNGAGKSTLLKILSGITPPTKGTVELYGRVGSLLEVGTGFHPELTGRDNVYLNGSILGMRKREIDLKFDDIVDFSGVGKFLDTPVKRYSSGMKVRLAFAVAAFLEPEILIIDEVLAVGDAEFQKQCLGKMSDVANSGRTVLFVSHNLTAVRSLCTKGILLEAGTVSIDGTVDAALNKYMSDASHHKKYEASEPNQINRAGSGEARIISASIHPAETPDKTTVAMGDNIQLNIRILGFQAIDSIRVAANFYDEFGLRITAINSEVTSNLTISTAERIVTNLTCTIPHINLCPGKYPISLTLLGTSIIDHIDSAITLDVQPADVYGTGRTAGGKTLIYYKANWKSDTSDYTHAAA